MVYVRKCVQKYLKVLKLSKNFIFMCTQNNLLSSKDIQTAGTKTFLRKTRQARLLQGQKRNILTMNMSLGYLR